MENSALNKCRMCGTVISTKFSGEYRIEFKSPGNYDIAVSRDNICDRCMTSLYPMFTWLVDECSPICNNPWELKEKNNKLKNKISELEAELNLDHSRIFINTKKASLNTDITA